MIKDNKAVGQKLWKELHEHAYAHDGSDDSVFIAKFSKKIPRFLKGCACNEFWKKWIRQHPPTYAKDKYFKWTVETHNAVNTKLKKPQMSYEQAVIIVKNNLET
jgi:hypothetical protein